MTLHYFNRSMFIFEGHAGYCEKSIYGQPDVASQNEEFVFINCAFCYAISQCLM